jgi:hypothetical protein
MELEYIVKDCHISGFQGLIYLRKKTFFASNLPDDWREYFQVLWLELLYETKKVMAISMESGGLFFFKK